MFSIYKVLCQNKSIKSSIIQKITQFSNIYTDNVRESAPLSMSFLLQFRPKFSVEAKICDKVSVSAKPEPEFINWSSVLA